jgi:uncharacterized membrane protein YccC
VKIRKNKFSTLSCQVASLFVRWRRIGESRRRKNRMWEILLFFVFAVIFAMIYNYGFPMLSSATGSWSWTATYWGATLLTAVFFFVALLVVGFVFSLVGVRAKEGNVAVGAAA